MARRARNAVEKMREPNKVDWFVKDLGVELGGL
jgi:hypothetical protein